MSALLNNMFGPDPSTVKCRCAHSKEEHFENAMSSSCRECTCDNFSPDGGPPENPHVRVWWERRTGG